jgi:hypothetical protein
MLEYHWKNQVQEMGAKAQNVFLEQLGSAFPRLEMLGDVRCPPPPNTLLVAKSHKRGRVFDPFGEKQPAYVARCWTGERWELRLRLRPTDRLTG